MEFTSKQKEIVARKMGYDGPMQMFDEFLAASPSDSQRYSAITSKFAERMAKGGMVKKYANGGLTTVETNTGATPTGSNPTPVVPNATGYTAATTDVTDAMKAEAAKASTSTTAVAPELVKETTTVSTPTAITAPTITAATATPAVTQAMQGVQAEQGVVSEQAKVQAVEQVPTTTAVSNIEAAQGTAAKVEAVPVRTAQEGEMVAGPTVDQAKVEQTFAQAKAEQGVVTEEMTVQGQLNKMLSNFDAGNPPAWAAGSLRAATAQLAARGLGASSLAGQAIIQAALEAATPIATADAKVFETMGITNLSNRQQMAVLTAQQRADFLKQEFDQAFQTRVVNAARVADIADKNFDAQTQVALENSRLTNSMNIANLSAKNAVVLAKAAQIANLETQNLNNRQQAAVTNAQAFLAMDVKNLETRQQTMMFKAQEISDAIVSDASFENATRATNATNALDANKISATLAATAEQFNATQRNNVKIANANSANELAKFNAQQANAREEFNANLSTQINIANAKILADISTANTAAVNAANAVNAKNATELSSAAYSQQMQTYRDLLSMSWKTGESEKDRVTELAKATISASASTDAANIKADSDSASKLGDLFSKVIEKYLP
jgi:hypothetical protein